MFIASCFAGIMAIIVTAGVFWRYVLNNSLPWVEDISLILMVTMAFIVAPYAYRTGQNVAISLLVERLPAPFLLAIRIVINVLVLWIVCRYFLESLKLVERGWNIRVNSVDMPWAYPYLVLPVVLLQLGMVAVELIASDTWRILTGSGERSLPDPKQRQGPG